jgi:hypothetical protein
LLQDLENLLSPFFAGQEDEFIAIAEGAMEAQQQQHENDSRHFTSRYSGEDRLRAQARELFRQDDTKRLSK